MNKINCSEPPLSHVSAVWDENKNILSYIYDGRTIVTVHIPSNAKFSYRTISDGNLCSDPMAQQMYITMQEDMWARVEFTLSDDAINMRPRRAESGEAILGQCGRPLIYGANGMYDINDDLMISWHGRQWRWIDNSLHQDGSVSRCAMEVKLGPTPWVLLFCLQYYRTHLGFKYYQPWKRKPNKKAVTGWCSWEAYRKDIYAHHILETATFLSKEFAPFGLEYIQVDDGYQDIPQPVDINQSFYDVFLKTNKKFPNGHKDIILPIKEEGFNPGIWTNVAITNSDFAKHASFIFKDDDGTPIKCDWIGYCMDCSDKTINEQVKPLYEGLKNMGYKYFKVDFIRHLLYDGLRKMVNKKLLTNEEATQRFRALMEGVREGIGDDGYLLACWGVLSEVVGVADACRISTDADPNWSQIRMQLFETARWFFTQRILYTNDPDHICVRAELEHARTVLSLVSLTGGLYMLSDAVDKYDDQRINMIRRTMPALDTMTAETGPVNYTQHAWAKVIDWDKAATCEENPFGSLWCIHFRRNGRNWAVAGRFAIEKLKGLQVPLNNLGLNPEHCYAVYDFWANEFLGFTEGTVEFKPLNMGCCQVLALRKIEDIPCFIASNRHVSMDAVSVVHEKYSDGKLEFDLDGVQGFKFSYFIYVPKGMQVESISASGAAIEVENKGFLCIMQVYFIEKYAKVEIIFKNNK